MSRRKKKETRFLFWFLLFPVVQFLIFYIGVNFNSFLLAFQKFEDGGMVFAGFENFIEVLKDIFVTGELQLAVKNSAIQFVVATIIGMPLHILVAYMIFKKIPGHSFFKVMLFMPNMISAMVFVVCGRYLIQDGFPQIFNLPELNLLNEYADTSFYTVLIFGFWMQFAGALLIYFSKFTDMNKGIIDLIPAAVEAIKQETMKKMELFGSVDKGRTVAVEREDELVRRVVEQVLREIGRS